MAARTIFITGAASGIGLATARHFAARGWFVGLADIDEPGLARAQAGLGAASASRHRLDVRDRAAWVAVLDAFVAVHGKATQRFVGAQAKTMRRLQRFAPGLVRTQLLKQLSED